MSPEAPRSKQEKGLLVVQVAALGYELARHIPGWDFRPLPTIFPALTCPVQASFRTALAPREHGMEANGIYQPDLRKPFFWEQSSALVKGRRIWENFRAEGGTVAMICWQQSLGEEADYIISPAPIHKHGGGMILECALKPQGLLKPDFPLHRYWGPLADDRSTQWIVEATLKVIRERQPGLVLTYLPTLDYQLQRKGRDPKGIRQIATHLDRLRKESGYRLVVFGDYAITPARRPIYINRVLRRMGLFKTRRVRGMLYPDFHNSRAFALVDHQVAHIFGETGLVQKRFPELVRDLSPDGSRLTLLAPDGEWFAYPWWTRKSEAPDYARHIDIHNKPGYDPTELFFFDRRAESIRGTHGSERPLAAVASDLPFHGKTLIDLAQTVKAHLDQCAADLRRLPR